MQRSHEILFISLASMVLLSAFLFGAMNYRHYDQRYLVDENANYGSFPYRGVGPYIMQSQSCNPLFGCKSVADSHMYVGNAIDYAYYTHPELLEPRYMDNHQRTYKGLRPQAFVY
jgi:hypothetical protein